MAGEIVETSQVFARTVAGIDPAWIAQLAPHLCRVVHEQPHWDAHQGRVVVQEKTLFQGMDVRKRKVDFGKVDPEEATKIFIRSALVEGGLVPESTEESTLPGSGRSGRGKAKRSARAKGQQDKEDSRVGRTRLQALQELSSSEAIRRQFPFFEHNRQLIQKIENWQTRMRKHELPDLDGLMVDFYNSRISNI